MCSMNKLKIKSFALAALCALAAVACDPDYNVDPGKTDPQNPDKPGPVIDPTISILPSVSLGVNRQVDLTVQEFVPKGYERIKTDKKDDFYIECHNDGAADTLLTKDAFEAASAVAIPAEFKIPFDLLPDYLEGQLNLQCPVVFDVENPMDEPLLLSAKIRNASKEVKVSDILVEAGKTQVVVDSVVTPLLQPFSSDLHITDVVLSRVKPSEDNGGQAEPASVSDFKFSVFPFMPLRFYAGDVIEFTYGADLFEKAKIKEFIEDNKLDSKYTKMSFEISVVNSIPFDLYISSKPGLASGSLSLSDKIAAGTPEAPVTSKLTLSTEFKKSIKDIYSLQLVVKASVPSGTEGYVTLNKAQKLAVDISKLTVDEIQL